MHELCYYWICTCTYMYIHIEFTQETCFFPFIIYNIIDMYNSFQKFSMDEDKDVIDLSMQLVCLNNVTKFSTFIDFVFDYFSRLTKP